MKVIEEVTYRCNGCGEPLLRDGGNRHTPDQEFSTWLCVNGRPWHLEGCVHFGVRVRIPIKYVVVDNGS